MASAEIFIFPSKQRIKTNPHRRDADAIKKDYEMPEDTVLDEVEVNSPTMDFGGALAAVKQGHRIARNGWNGKDMFVFLVNGSVFNVNREPLLSIMGEGTEIQYRPHLDMLATDGSIGVWLASQSDILAEDWFIVRA